MLKAIDKELYLVDEDGNVIDVIGEGDKILRQEIKGYSTDTVRVNFPYLKTNQLAIGYVCNKYSMFGELIKHLGYMDNIIKYSNGVLAKKKDIHKICGVSKSYAFKQLKGLIDEDIVRPWKHNKQTYLVINPWICHRGRKIYRSLYEEFALTSWKDLAESVRKVEK